MGSDSGPLHVFFFPFMAQGHLIPMIDLARLFASHGVHSTIITTPVNAVNISKTIQNETSVVIKTIPFQGVEVGLPDGCENLELLPSGVNFFQFFHAANLLRAAFEDLLELEKPDCLVSDQFFTWSVDSADKFNIPRISFHGTSFFALCAMENIRLYKPYKSVCSDSELFLISNLPDDIRMTRTQYPVEEMEHESKGLGKLFADASESELKSLGMVFNSFYELEPSYAEHCKVVMNKKARCVGPISLCNQNVQEKFVRGKRSAIDDQECLKWMEGKELDSIVYVRTSQMPSCTISHWGWKILELISSG